MNDFVEFLGIKYQKKEYEYSKRVAIHNRLFGIIYENLINQWFDKNNKKSRYRSLSAPSVYNKEGGYLHITYDYCLEDKKTGKKYIVEAKCWVSSDNFEYLDFTLKGFSDYYKHLQEKKEQGNEDEKALRIFFELEKDMPYSNYIFKFGDDKEEFKPDGKILIWSRIDENDKNKIMDEFNFHEIFSVEKIIFDLIDNKDDNYVKDVKLRKRWTNELFNALLGKQ